MPKTHREKNTVWLDGRKVRACREVLGLTQVGLSEFLGSVVVSWRTIEDIEQKSPHKTTLAIAKALAGAFYCDINALIWTQQASRTSDEELISPFIGRGDALERLNAAWRDAISANGSVVFVVGEFGAGKTTLIRHFIRSVGLASFVVPVTCAEQMPMTIDEANTSSSQLQPFWDIVESLRLSFPQICTLMGSRPSFPFWTEGRVVRGPLERAAASLDQVRREFVSLIAAVAELAPTVIWLEDIQLMSRASIAMFAHLAARCGGSRLLVVAEMRTSETTGAFHQEISEQALRGRGSLIELGCFSPGQTERRVRLEFPQNTFPPWLYQEAFDITGGNPLFLEHLIRELRAQEMVVEHASISRVVVERPRLLHAIPQTLLKAVARTISHLDGAQKRVLLFAALCGKEFNLAIVSTAMSESYLSVKLTCDKLVAELKILSVPRSGTQRSEVGDRLRFAHGLYREEVLRSCSPLDRVEACEQLAAALINFHGGDADAFAGQLAQLLDWAGDVPSSAKWYRTAAETAARCFDDEGAIDLCKSGLLVASRLRPGIERDELELALHLTYGMVLTAARGFTFPEVEEQYSLAQRLLPKVGSRELQLPILFGRWVYHVVRADMDVALSVAREMVAITVKAQWPTGQAEAYAALALTQEFRGDFDESLESVRAGLASYQPAGKEFHTLYLRLDPRVNLLCTLERTETHRGRYESALSAGNQAIEYSDAIAQPYSQSFSRMFLSYTYYFLGDIHRAVTISHEAINQAVKFGLSQVIAWASVCHGRLLAEEANTRQQGIAEIEGALKALLEQDAFLCFPQFHRMYAEALDLAHRVPEAVEAISQGIGYAESTRNLDHLAELHRLRGDILVRRFGNESEGKKEFLTAIAIARSQGAMGLEIRAVRSLVDLLVTKGALAEAGEHLDDILNRTAIEHDSPDLRAIQEFRSKLE